MVALKHVGDSNLELKRMFVHTDHQGQGIGKLLVQNLLSHAKKTRRPDSIISLICTNSRRGPLQFYQNLGFRQSEAAKIVVGWIQYLPVVFTGIVDIKLTLKLDEIDINCMSK